MSFLNPILAVIATLAIVYFAQVDTAMAKDKYECASIKDAKFVDGRNGYCWSWIVKESTGRTITIGYNFNIRSLENCKEEVVSKLKQAEFYCPRIP